MWTKRNSGANPVWYTAAIMTEDEILEIAMCRDEFAEFVADMSY